MKATGKKQSKSKPTPGWKYPIDVWIYPAKPNPMFGPFQTETTKFLEYKEPVACGHCGKMSRHHWTCLMFFRVMNDLFQFQMTPGKTLHPPMTPVCRKHILQAPTVPNQPPGKKNAEKSHGPKE